MAPRQRASVEQKPSNATSTAGASLADAVAQQAAGGALAHVFLFQRNGGGDLRAWLDYHAYIFGHAALHVIDHRSNDSTTLKLLERYRNKGVATHVCEKAYTRKHACMTHVMSGYVNRTALLIPLDIDEFVVFTSKIDKHPFQKLDVDKVSVLREVRRIVRKHCTPPPAASSAIDDAAAAAAAAAYTGESAHALKFTLFQAIPSDCNPLCVKSLADGDNSTLADHPLAACTAVTFHNCCRRKAMWKVRHVMVSAVVFAAAVVVT